MFIYLCRCVLGTDARDPRHPKHDPLFALLPKSRWGMELEGSERKAVILDVRRCYKHLLEAGPAPSPLGIRAVSAAPAALQPPSPQHTPSPGSSTSCAFAALSEPPATPTPALPPQGEPSPGVRACCGGDSGASAAGAHLPAVAGSALSDGDAAVPPCTPAACSPRRKRCQEAGDEPGDDAVDAAGSPKRCRGLPRSGVFTALHNAWGWPPATRC